MDLKSLYVWQVERRRQQARLMDKIKQATGMSQGELHVIIADRAGWFMQSLRIKTNLITPKK